MCCSIFSKYSTNVASDEKFMVFPTIFYLNSYQKYTKRRIIVL